MKLFFFKYLIRSIIPVRIKSIFIVLFLSFVLFFQKHSFSTETEILYPKRILIEMKKEYYKSNAIKDASKTINAKIIKEFSRGKYVVLEILSDESSLSASKKIIKHPGVKNASPVYSRHLFSTIPNDTLFNPNQWALNNTGQTINFQANPEDPVTTLSCLTDSDIDAPEAWDITTGSSSIIVAVIDSGFPTQNIDLSPNLWVNIKEIAGNGIDDDNNGYVDDINGYNFNADTPDIEDDHGHGSFCSGIIGAKGNNSSGIAGINWNVSIMALKPFDSNGTAYDPELVESIEYAVNNGAKVINASWGDWLYSSVVYSAVRQAVEKGVLFISAAGNDSMDLIKKPHYPAAFTLPNHLCVGASDWRDRWAIFSNFNDRLVDVHAPGYWVYSSRPTLYEYASGTSFAAPMVVGISALIMAKDPSASPETVRTRLITAFDERSALGGRGFNNGRISAFLALKNSLNDSDPPAEISDLKIIQTESNGFRLTFTAPADDNKSERSTLYDIRISTDTITNENFLYCDRVHFVPKPSSPGSREFFYINELEPAENYFIRIMTYDEAGNSSLSNEVSATTKNRVTYFSDNMENGDSLWTISGTFALTEEASRSGNWCWTDSPKTNYEKGKIGTITTKNPIDLSNAKNPWLRFYHQHIFDKSITSIYDNGQVQISTDGINFSTIDQYVHIYTPFHRSAYSLISYAGNSSVWLRFRFRSDSFNNADGWYIDDIEVYEPESIIPEPLDIAVECKTQFGITSGKNYIETNTGGNWMDSVGKAVDYRLTALSKSRYCLINTLGSTATFIPTISVEGEYDVYAIWGEYANASNVRYKIAHLDGITDIYITQDARYNASQWIKLGKFYFKRGLSASTCSVTVDSGSVTGKPNSSIEGRVYSDSIRFTYIPPEIKTGFNAFTLY